MDGVALAAIQGLNQKVEEKELRIRELEKTVQELKELVGKLAGERREGMANSGGVTSTNRD
jgi:hypothetical protein